MRFTIVSGWEMSETWLALTSMVVAPIRFAMKRSSSGLMVRSSVDTAYQLGFDRHAAWRSKASWYAVSTEDRTINPDLQRFMAKRMGAKTIEVKASHVSLISQPETIAKLILEAAGRT